MADETILASSVTPERGVTGGAAPRRGGRRAPTEAGLGVLILRRLAVIPLAVLIVATLSFFLVGLSPSDPARTVLGDFADQDSVDAFNQQYGLDQSLWHQYLDYLGRLAHGDLGTSYYSSESVATQIGRYIFPTLELVVLSLALAVALGIGVGVVASYARRRLSGRLARIWTAATQSIPDFALGLVLIYVFFFLLRVAPAPTGQLGILDEQPRTVTHAALVDALITGSWSAVGPAISHLVLPVVALGVVYSATFSRMTTALLGEALASPQVEFARACGLSEWMVVRYALLAVRGPIITYIAILSGFLIGGEAVIETVFAWQGLGQWALTGMLKLDVPVIQGFILVAGALTLLIYLVLDVVVMLLDPRIRHSRKARS